jgi:hypothetical protein
LAIKNIRLQHSVGQGFFHSSAIYDDEGKRLLLYIYDCGSMELYAVDRAREIQQFLENAGAQSRLDILFLSHVHADHISGLEQLLDATSGVRVDTIVLPLVDVTERLVAFARTLVEDGIAAHNSFYQDFVVDPEEALSRFGPRRIISIFPGDRDTGAPDGRDRPLYSLDSPQAEHFQQEWESPWSLRGRGAIEVSAEAKRAGADTSGPALRLRAPDTLAFALSKEQGSWLLAPFVDPATSEKKEDFLAALANQCGVKREDFDSWLRVTSNVRRLVTKEIRYLVTAYRTIAKDLNVTSLCLYSGPTREKNSSTSKRYLLGSFGRFNYESPMENAAVRTAWLATGDAALKNSQRREDFVTHYGELLEEVVTLTLPHHGSDHNFHPDLLKSINPTFCIAAADQYGSWKHPGPHAIQSVCSHPALLHVVTSSERSRTVEIALFDWRPKS